MAGQFFLPYGLRIQDDTAFIRQVTGVNFFNSDRGVLIGYQAGALSTQLSLTNGSGGAGDTDTGKQVSAIIHYVRPAWRVGASFNHNDTDVGTRQMQNIFGGLRTGPIAWLFEVDLIIDDAPGTESVDSVAGLAEGNWLFRKGHNLKISFDYYDPNRDVANDHQVRWSGLWEWTPFQFVQARFGYRAYDGIPQSNTQNREQFFAELHGWF